MGLINITTPSDGETADAADVATPLNTIVNEFNGNISNANIASDAAIAGSKLADASITNAKLSTTAGELGGAWQSWTPTLTNLSGGTINYAKYTQVGKTVHFRFKYTLAGAGVAGAVTVSLPVTRNADIGNSESINANVHFVDANGSQYPATHITSSSNTITLLAINASGTYSVINNISSTVPFTWAASDTIDINGSYEAA